MWIGRRSSLTNFPRFGTKTGVVSYILHTITSVRFTDFKFFYVVDNLVFQNVQIANHFTWNVFRRAATSTFCQILKLSQPQNVHMWETSRTNTFCLPTMTVHHGWFEIILGKCIPRFVYIVLKLVRRDIGRIQKLSTPLNIFFTSLGVSSLFSQRAGTCFVPYQKSLPFSSWKNHRAVANWPQPRTFGFFLYRRFRQAPGLSASLLFWTSEKRRHGMETTKNERIEKIFFSTPTHLSLPPQKREYTTATATATTTTTYWVGKVVSLHVKCKNHRGIICAPTILSSDHPL